MTPLKRDRVAIDTGERRNRRAAGPIELTEECALGFNRDERIAVIDGGKDLFRFVIGGAQFDADGALRRGWEHILNRDQLRDAVGEPQTLQARKREQGCIGFACFELAKPRLHVAAEQDHLQVGPLVTDEGLAADGRRSHDRA